MIIPRCQSRPRYSETPLRYRGDRNRRSDVGIRRSPSAAEVIVSDITLPIFNGIEAIHRLRTSNSQAKVLFLTIHAEEGFLKACMAEGALGYVLKSRMKSQLIPAIEAALEGKSYVSPFVAK